MSLLYFAAWVNLSNTHDDSNNYYVPGMAKTLLLFSKVNSECFGVNKQYIVALNCYIAKVYQWFKCQVTAHGFGT